MYKKAELTRTYIICLLFRVWLLCVYLLFQEYFFGLEKEAQIWAEQCKMVHDGNYQRFQPGTFLYVVLYANAIP